MSRAAQLASVEQAPQAPIERHLSLVPPLVENPVDEPPQEAVVAQIISETAEDTWSRYKAERLIRKAAQAVLQDEVSVEYVAEHEEQQDTNLLTNAIRAKHESDPMARKSVETNAHTEGSEIVYKAGMINQIQLEVDDNETILQYGQSTDSIHFNGLRYAADSPEMYERSKAEARNNQRIKDVRRQGHLKDNYVLIMSRVPSKDNDWLKEHRFFETKSMVLQLVGENEDGSLSFESVFTAGVIDADAERHDVAAIELFGERLGVDLTNMTDVELLDASLLVSKELLPNGSTDVAVIMDDCIEEVTGEPVFFGQDQPKQDYIAYREVCRKKLAELEPKTKAAAAKFIAQADDLKNPVDAVERLHKLVEAEMVEKAIEDRTVDPQVFGSVAAKHIRQARSYIEQGDMLGALNSIKMAKKTADSFSCPSELRKRNSDQENNEANQEGSDQNKDADCKEVKNGDVVNCPFCKQKVKAIVPKKGGEIFCNNKDCSAAHSTAKNAKI